MEVDYKLKNIVIPETIEPVFTHIILSFKHHPDFTKEKFAQVIKTLGGEVSDARSNTFEREVILKNHPSSFGLFNILVARFGYKSIRFRFDLKDFVPYFGKEWVPAPATGVRLCSDVLKDNADIASLAIMTWEQNMHSWWKEVARPKYLTWAKLNEKDRQEEIKMAGTKLEKSVKEAIERALILEMPMEEIKARIEKLLNG